MINYSLFQVRANQIFILHFLSHGSANILVEVVDYLVKVEHHFTDGAKTLGMYSTALRVPSMLWVVYGVVRYISLEWFRFIFFYGFRFVDLLYH